MHERPSTTSPLLITNCWLFPFANLNSIHSIPRGNGGMESLLISLTRVSAYYSTVGVGRCPINKEFTAKIAKRKCTKERNWNPATQNRSFGDTLCYFSHKCDKNVSIPVTGLLIFSCSARFNRNCHRNISHIEHLLFQIGWTNAFAKAECSTYQDELYSRLKYFII